MSLGTVSSRSGCRSARSHPASEHSDFLVRLAAGDEVVWDKVVGEYGNLVWSIARSFGFSTTQAADVCQVTWLRLLEHARSLRRPERLGAWLATTARRECLRQVRAGRREVLVASQSYFERDHPGDTAVDAAMLASEQDAALGRALEALPARCRRLLDLLTTDPPRSYADISETLGLPVGSIGPTRARCLDCLRRSGAVRAVA